MKRQTRLSEAEHLQVSAAVALAEAGTAGEIVTIVAEQSDSYSDIVLGWCALFALAALAALIVAPGFYLGIYDWLIGAWVQDRNPRAMFAVAAAVAALKFMGSWLLLQWQPLRLAVVPAAIRHARVRSRAIDAFRIGAERRTAGRTGILIYLSLREHRAEIVADEAINTAVGLDVWGDAMAAMLPGLRLGNVGDALCAGVEKVGAVLAAHLPRQSADQNELPDRLIEV